MSLEIALDAAAGRPQRRDHTRHAGTGYSEAECQECRPPPDAEVDPRGDLLPERPQPERIPIGDQESQPGGEHCEYQRFDEEL